MRQRPTFYWLRGSLEAFGSFFFALHT